MSDPGAPFAQAFAELRAIVGREKEYDLKRWRERWIDEYGGLASVTPLEELQQVDEKARLELLTSRVEAQAYALGRSLVTRNGVMGKEMRREPVGGTEYRLFLCVVRAEPKTDPEEARVVKELLDYRDKGIEPPALKAYRKRADAMLGPEPKP